MSRQAWEKAMALGWVRVDGRLAKKTGEQVNDGARVTVDLPAVAPAPATREPELIWRDGDLAVFNKEAGIQSLPLFPWETETFSQSILKFAEREGLPFLELGNPPSMEGGLLQRLDQFTSGLVAAAFSKETKERYRPIFSGQVEKEYLAVLSGEAAGSHHLYFPQSTGEKVGVKSAGKEGEVAVHLQVEDVVRTGKYAISKVRTSHGMRHVVRAGLAHLGAPLVGDSLYGGEAVAPHYQLHASRLKIPGYQEISAPPPKSFLDCARDLKLQYPG